MKITYNKDKVLYTFYTKRYWDDEVNNWIPERKHMIMKGENGKFIARWDMERDDFTEDFSTIEKAMKWIHNEDLTAEEVEEEE
jgi:hypothetical protein